MQSIQVSTLHVMFPHLQRDVVSLVLEVNNGNLERTVENLIALGDSTVAVEAPPEQPVSRQPTPVASPVLPRPTQNFDRLVCLICLDADVPPTELVACPSEQPSKHGACRECLSNYLNFEVMNKMGDACRCPHTECRREFPDAELRARLPPDVFRKYSRFRLTKQDPNFRECPRCSELVLGQPDAGPAMVCPAAGCGYKFCFHHGDSHPGRGCPIQVESPVTALKSAWWRLWHTRSCPQCGTSIEKNGGCMHMTCKKCAHQWCWVCKAPTHGGCPHTRLWVLAALTLIPLGWFLLPYVLWAVWGLFGVAYYIVAFVSVGHFFLKELPNNPRLSFVPLVGIAVWWALGSSFLMACAFLACARLPQRDKGPAFVVLLAALAVSTVGFWPCLILAVFGGVLTAPPALQRTLTKLAVGLFCGLFLGGLLWFSGLLWYLVFMLAAAIGLGVAAAAMHKYAMDRRQRA